MTRGAALLLALGIAGAAFLYGGVWEYGDGFIFNRFNGEVIYVTLPDEEAVRLPAGEPGRRPALPLPPVRRNLRLVSRARGPA